MDGSHDGPCLNREAELVAIVRDLAAGDPEATQEIGGDPMCTLCNGRSFADDPHEPSCPWRRAREWCRL